jgi:hypothetical protein
MLLQLLAFQLVFFLLKPETTLDGLGMFESKVPKFGDPLFAKI